MFNTIEQASCIEYYFRANHSTVQSNTSLILFIRSNFFLCVDASCKEGLFLENNFFCWTYFNIHCFVWYILHLFSFFYSIGWSFIVKKNFFSGFSTLFQVFYWGVQQRHRSGNTSRDSVTDRWLIVQKHAHFRNGVYRTHLNKKSKWYMHSTRFEYRFEVQLEVG